MATSSDEHKVLTRKKLTQILKESQNAKEVEIVDTKLTAMSTLGKNYSGDIVFCKVKAKVDGSEKDFDWAVKLPPYESKERMPMHRETYMEKKEIFFYRNVLPAWKKMIKDREAEIHLNCHASPYTEYQEGWEDGGSIIVMENMNKLGFKDAIDKKWGLDIHHAMLAMKELAKFHALGYAYLKSYPGGTDEGFEKNDYLVNDYAFVKYSPSMQKTIDAINETFFPGFVTTAKAVQEPGQDFAAAIVRFNAKENVFDQRQRMYGPDVKGFKTTCHGDAQLNNILFKYALLQKLYVVQINVTFALTCSRYEEREGGVMHPVAASWIDIAVSRYSNPCGDLSYFFYNSITPQLRRTHLEKLLGCYHDELTRCLAKLGEDPAVYPYRWEKILVYR